MRRAIVVAAIACLAFGCRPRLPRTAVQPGQWALVDLPEVGFRIGLPQYPHVERRPQVADDGAPMTVVSGSLVLMNIVCGFRILEDRAGLEGHPLDSGAFVDMVAENVPGNRTAPDTLERVDDRPVVYRGFLARDATLVDRQHGFNVQVRTILGRTRAYIVFVAYDAQIASQMQGFVQQVLGSVAIDRRDASAPMGDGTLDPSAWAYVHPLDGEFAALLPGAARHERGSIPLGSERHDVDIYTVQGSGVQLQIAVVHLGHAAKSEDFDNISARMGARGLAETERHDIQLQGYAGREVRFRADDRAVISRFYGTQGRIYELRVTTLASASDDPATHARRFFDSFRIL